MKSKRAITMIELIFTIVIIGILSAISLPKLASTMDDAKVTQCIEQVTLYMRDISNYYTSQGRFALDMKDMSNVTVFEKIPLTSNGSQGEYYFVCDKINPTITEDDAAVTFKFSKVDDGSGNIRTNFNAKVSSLVKGTVDGDLGNLLKKKHIATDGLGIDHSITGIRVRR
jgi:type II secretory pathway pseudopilin PulG